MGARDDQDQRSPPFGAQVILNGHEYVACAQKAALGFAKEGNCT
jgi:uncharacterized membrane protein